jgi:hypothetical protein
MVGQATPADRRDPAPPLVPDAPADQGDPSEEGSRGSVVRAEIPPADPPPLPEPVCVDPGSCEGLACVIEDGAAACADRECCGDAGCVQRCRSPGDCPRCRPSCEEDGSVMVCVGIAPSEDPPECRSDAECILVDRPLPCQVCGSCPSDPRVQTRRAWNRALREARAQCGRRRRGRGRPRCSPCRALPAERYVPGEAICVEGRCVPHGGGIVSGSDPLQSMDQL